MAGGAVPEEAPRIVMLAGPNGAGKSTVAPRLLVGALGVTEFVNADVIARGLSAFAPDRVAIQAGKLMLARIRELASKRESFAFETTLASRSFARWLRELTDAGYEFHLLFLYLSTAHAAVERVMERVRLGGHSVPEETIRRRYRTGLRNFFSLYMPLATSWCMYNNSGDAPVPIAMSSAGGDLRVKEPAIWNLLERQYGNPVKKKARTVAGSAEDRRIVDEAVREAVREALIRHKQAGNSVVFYKNGKLVLVPPEQIPVH